MSLSAGEAASEIETDAGEQDGDIPRTSALRSISMEEMDIERELANIPAERGTWSRVIFLWICVISIFLSPVVIVSGMTASHGDGWKQMFFGVFAAWLILCATGLFLDLRGLAGKAIAKRCLWHLGCCIALLWFFISTLQITSDNLPQWIPTAVDCGLGASLGLQNIPASSRNRIGRLIGNILSGIFSGIQGTLRQSTEPLLPRDEPNGSSRQSGQDVQSSGGTER